MFNMLNMFQSIVLLISSLFLAPGWFNYVVHASSSRPYERTSTTGYGTITTSVNGSVLRASINNPPINFYDKKLADDLFSFVNSLVNQTDIKVVILASANPDFWIAHYDIRLLSGKYPPTPLVNATEVNIKILSTVNSLATLPVIFIAEISGRTTGAGNEIALQTDIRYAGPGTRLSQFEVGFNLLPGAGGIQYLVALIGRARTLEYILSGRGVDAETAAAIGWVNQAFATDRLLREEVDTLAHRIASFSTLALATIKQRVNQSKPSLQNIIADNAFFLQLFQQQPESAAASDRYLELSKFQTPGPFELDLPAKLEELNR